METERARDLAAEADELLEANEFTKAVKAYREAALLAPPTSAVLVNLHLAEQHERLAYYRKLGQEHPRSLLSRLCEAEELARARAWARAIDSCTECLSAFPSDPTEEVQIRTLRLRTALESRRYATVAEDVRKTWFAGEQHAPLKRVRSRLIEKLAAIEDMEAAPILEAIGRESWIPTSMRCFLESKILELKQLDQAVRTCGGRQRRS